MGTIYQLGQQQNMIHISLNHHKLNGVFILYIRILEVVK